MITIFGEITSPEGNKLGELLPLEEFSVTAALSRDDKLRVINQSIAVLDGLYAHLPLKAALFTVNPIQELRLLESRFDAIPDLEFHRQMINIFLRLRDRHTTYQSRFTGGVATLPFRIERCFDGERMLYVVSDVFSQVNDPHFVKGVEVTHWNSIPIARAVEINGERLPGANP